MSLAFIDVAILFLPLLAGFLFCCLVGAVVTPPAAMPGLSGFRRHMHSTIPEISLQANKNIRLYVIKHLVLRITMKIYKKGYFSIICMLIYIHRSIREHAFLLEGFTLVALRHCSSRSKDSGNHLKRSNKQI
jgi:hypothetical protein